MSTTQTVWELLESIPDPEIPVVSLRELGILRDVRETANGMEVVITPTYSGCPAMEQIADDVRACLREHQIAARVVTQLAPAWTTDWMSEATREKLRAYGIAPPTGQCAQAGPRESVVQFLARDQRESSEVPCPRCSSTQTTQTARFGSTACKSLYRCLSCHEPFDYFKPY